MPDSIPPGNSSSFGGFGDHHPPPELLPILVAPSTGKEKNVLRMELIPVACWKLNDIRFQFGSSFVLPESREEFAELAALRHEHPGAPLSIFGHADPVDDEDFNKALSGRRAETVYAILTADASRWEKLYNSAGSNEGWGIGSIQTMLAVLEETPVPSSGELDSQTRTAIEAWQDKKGLMVDGSPGPATRKSLYEAYSAFLFPETLAKIDFLGKGADDQGKADFQGCSEFNPVLVFSAAEHDEYSESGNEEKRNEENQVNRRVVALLFRPGTDISIAKWPCPRASEGVAACKKRFWSDGNQRRAPQQSRREYAESKDTFACRFYHRLTHSSPCERTRPQLRIRLHDSLGHKLPGAPFSIKYAGHEVAGQADPDGFVTEFLDPSAETCTLSWRASTDGASFELTVYVRLLDPGSEEGLRRRLQNLGYAFERSLPFNLSSFQAHRDLEITGELDAATQQKLNDICSAALDEFAEPLIAEPATAPDDEERT